MDAGSISRTAAKLVMSHRRSVAAVIGPLDAFDSWPKRRSKQTGPCAKTELSVITIAVLREILTSASVR